MQNAGNYRVAARAMVAAQVSGARPFLLATGISGGGPELPGSTETTPSTNGTIAKRCLRS